MKRIGKIFLNLIIVVIIIIAAHGVYRVYVPKLPEISCSMDAAKHDVLAIWIQTLRSKDIDIPVTPKEYKDGVYSFISDGKNIFGTVKMDRITTLKQDKKGCSCEAVFLTHTDAYTHLYGGKSVQVTTLELLGSYKYEIKYAEDTKKYFAQLSYTPGNLLKDEVKKYDYVDGTWLWDDIPVQDQVHLTQLKSLGFAEKFERNEVE